MAGSATYLPNRAPHIGELVEVRSRRWLVEAVDEPTGQTARVSLACADDDAQGQTLEVYWDFEIDRRILQQEAWSDLGKKGFDPPRHFSAFLHTLRWNCVTATDPNLFQSPFRAGIKIDAYQMEPLRKALRLARVKLFIADDTGLGKTIEAGLIARELLLRKKARTVVVAAPASVLEQWKAEMEERFGLLFVILDRAYLAQVRRDRGFGVNPWRTHSRFLVSHNLLIDPAYADPMREWLGDLAPGSLLILHEAHHAAPSSGGRYGIETKFTRAIRDLGGRFEHRLFLSATPHNGHSNSFATLLELLDPYRVTRGVPVRGKSALEDVMVRRIKEDIREIQGGFPTREVRRVVIDGLPDDAPELVLSRLLDEYRGVRETRFENVPARTRAAAGLLVVGLQQKLLSSIEAFAISLARHRKTAREQWARFASGNGQDAAAGRDTFASQAASRFATPPDADDDHTDEENAAEEAAQIEAVNVATVGSARHSIWVCSYAFFDGPRAFATLAGRLDANPQLKVMLLLNIERRHGDTTAADTLVRRFADRFWGKEWPGNSRPRVYYDPRSVADDGRGGVLHAQAVVVDDEAVFVTSANLTEAAFDRNIELGFLVRDRTLATTTVLHFQTLIEQDLLQLLPSS